MKSASISKAQNDCIDVSGGKYLFINLSLQFCGDKGISVGEKSNLVSSDILVKNTNTAISSKDLSITNIKNANFINVKECYQVFQKKQEFGGSIIKFNNISCSGKKIIDENSMVKNISNDL